MFGITEDSIKKWFMGLKRSEKWYKSLFDVFKTKYLGGNVKKAYRKYEIFCEVNEEPAFPLTRINEIYDQIMSIYNEIREY